MFIKTIVGWMFGFNKEISQMKKELGHLGVDKAWGLHTKSVLSLVNGSNGDAEKTVALLSFESLAERKKEFGNQSKELLNKKEKSIQGLPYIPHWG